MLVGLAERRPPAALVLRSPFTSLLDVARAHLPLVPAGVDRRPLGLARAHPAASPSPLLVLAGTADRVVPYEQSVRLFEAAPGPKRLVTFEGADHNDPALAFGARLLDETARFLADAIGFAAPGLTGSGPQAVARRRPPGRAGPDRRCGTPAGPAASSSAASGS